MWPFDQNKQQVYQKYAQAYDTGDYSNIDPYEAQEQWKQFVQNAPPEEQEEVYRQHFARMSPDQRVQVAQHFPPEYGVNPNDPQSLARGTVQVSRERPDVAQRVLAHPVLVAGAVGLAAIVARHMLDKSQQQSRF